MLIDKWGNNWYKVALHLHTTGSDGSLTPEQTAQLYAKDGFDAIAITDHWGYYRDRGYHDGGELGGIKIISGVEYSVNTCGRDTIKGVMHIVGLGAKHQPIVSENPTRQEVIDAIRDAGGMAVLAHPVWSKTTIADVKELDGFSMVEIYNSICDRDGQTGYSGYLIDVLANEGIYLPLTATQDAHYYDGRDGIGYVMVNAKSDLPEDILEAIVKKNFYATQGPELYVRRQGNKIVVDCSECERVDFISNSSGGNKVVIEENITYAECEINEWEKWIRVEIRDKEGKCAWSNIFVI